MQKELRMEEEIRAYIETNLLPDGAALAGVDTPLFSAGLLDSFSMVNLLSYLAEKYGVEIDPTVVNIESLDTPTRIAELVRQGRGDAF
jgi:acyl carrier protein